MIQRWAVTGATGLFGNNLVRMLVAQGCEVSVLVRGTDRRELAGVDVRRVQGDLDDASALRDCFRGAQAVVHAAAVVWVGSTRADELWRVNVDGTRAVCDAMPAGARLVQISSVDVLGFGTLDAPSDEDVPPRPEHLGVGYGDSKRAADGVVRERVADHVILHPGFMLGAWDWRPSAGRMVLEVGRGMARFPPPGSNSFLHVEDACAATIAAAEQAAAGSRYILSNENLTYREAWDRIAVAIGAPRPVLTLPRFLGPLAGLALSVPEWLGLPEGEVNPVTARFGFWDHAFDPSRARRDLGIGTRPLEEGARDAWYWFGENGYR